MFLESWEVLRDRSHLMSFLKLLKADEKILRSVIIASQRNRSSASLMPQCDNKMRRDVASKLPLRSIIYVHPSTMGQYDLAGITPGR